MKSLIALGLVVVLGCAATIIAAYSISEHTGKSYLFCVLLSLLNVSLTLINLNSWLLMARKYYE